MPISWMDEIDPALFSGKKVLCRVDFNVPMDGENILDAERIELSLATIRYLLRAKAKIVLLSHLGRPKGKIREDLSLEPVAQYLRDLLNKEITFVHDCVGDGVTRILNNAEDESITFLENVRFNSGEEKNDPVFSKLLAKNMDFFINDAFGAIHRSHASVDGITKFFTKPLGGLLLKKELAAFDSITKPKKPMLALIGGSKVSTKILALQQLLKKVDTIAIGGAMAYTFLKALGENVGKSLVEEDKISVAEALLKRARDVGVKILLPKDHVVVTDIESKAGLKTISSGGFSANDIGVDIGPKTIELYAEEIEAAKTIFCNGPMGMYETPEFAHGTEILMKAIAKSEAFSLVGGGDSIAALNRVGLKKDMDFVSSGGGAGLELLEGKKLPGLMALGHYN